MEIEKVIKGIFHWSFSPSELLLNAEMRGVRVSVIRSSFNPFGPPVHPALPRLQELETLRELSRVANARIYSPIEAKVVLMIKSLSSDKVVS